MLTFPLSLDQFFAGLRILECSFRLPSAAVQSRTRGGEILTAEIGNRLWTARVTLRPLLHREASAVLAKLELLETAGASMMMMPWPMCGLADDRDGAKIAGRSPVISQISANNRELRISGLAPNLAISEGDFIGVPYGHPVRFGLHRVVIGQVANESGALGQSIEVVPPLRAGVAVGGPVTLYRPACKAVIVPNSVEDGQMNGNRREGISFSAIQTLR